MTTTPTNYAPNLPLLQDLPEFFQSTSTTHSKSTLSSIFQEPKPNLQSLPNEMLLQAVTGYASYGTILKLACVCKTFQPLSHLAVENASPSTRHNLSRAMLGLRSRLYTDSDSDSEDDCSDEEVSSNVEEEEHSFEVRFNPKRAMSLLRDLTITPSTTDDEFSDEETEIEVVPPSVQSEALQTLASAHLTSVSCSKESTLESRQHGLHLLERSFKLGSSAAGHKIAKINESGLYGLPINFEQSSKWYKMLADSGDVKGMVEYAVCLEMGYGQVNGEANEALALEWYLKAGELSHTVKSGKDVYSGEACSSIAEYFEEGKGGVVMDHTKACTWYARGGKDADCRRGLVRLEEVWSIMGRRELQE